MPEGGGIKTGGGERQAAGNERNFCGGLAFSKEGRKTKVKPRETSQEETN